MSPSRKIFATSSSNIVMLFYLLSMLCVSSLFFTRNVLFFAREVQGKEPRSSRRGIYAILHFADDSRIHSSLFAKRRSAAGRTFSRPVRRVIVPIPPIGREPAGTACPQQDSLFRFSFVPTATRRDGTNSAAAATATSGVERRAANLQRRVQS